MPSTNNYIEADSVLKQYTDQGLLLVKNNYITSIILDYIKKSHQNDPYRTLVEAIVAVIGLYYIIRNSKKYSNSKAAKVIDNLSPKEFDTLLQDWEPKPLVDPLPTDCDAKFQEKQVELFQWKLKKQPIVTQFNGDKINIITNDDPTTEKKDLFNLSHYNFLKLFNNDKYKDRLNDLTKKSSRTVGLDPVVQLVSMVMRIFITPWSMTWLNFWALKSVFCMGKISPLSHLYWPHSTKEETSLLPISCVMLPFKMPCSCQEPLFTTMTTTTWKI